MSNEVMVFTIVIGTEDTKQMMEAQGKIHTVCGKLHASPGFVVQMNAMQVVDMPKPNPKVDKQIIVKGGKK